METITSDVIIEILDNDRYQINNDNPEKGKKVRELMENVGWTYAGEVTKTFNGQPTTVAKYERE